MKLPSKILALGAILLLLPAASFAQAPTVTAIGDVTLNAGATILVNVVAVDPNGDAITLSASGAAFATLNAPTTGTGLVVTTLAMVPTVADLGTHTITVTATAAGETDTETFVVLVNAIGSNQAPVVVAPATQTVNEGQLLTFTVTASDADAQAITHLSVTGLPSGANFTPGAANASGTFSWTPSLTQAGSYDVIFIAANGLEGSATTHIQVMESTGGENHAPDLTAPATLSVNEGALVSFTVTATDADADHVTLTASGVPAGATFTDNGNNTASFSWTPGMTASGTYTITVTGNDGHGGIDTAVIVVTVIDVTGGNDAPVLSAPATRTVNEGATLTFNVSATDADGDVVNLTATGVPSGATFTDHDDNTGTFTWMPAGDQSGSYTVTFRADDGHGGIDTEATVITVLDVGGGGTANATAKLLGRIHRHRKFVCFKIEPVSGSFDVRNVDVASITLDFNGTSIDAMSSKTHISFDCDGEGDDDDDGDCRGCGDDGHWGSGSWGGRGWGDHRRRGDGDDDHDGHHGDDDDDDGDHDGDDDDGDDDDSGDCVATSVRACFSMRDLRDLFGDESIVDNLDEITISGDLTTGGSFVATVGARTAHGGNGHGDGKGHGGIHCQASPNPFNPQTVLTFTLSQPGRVRVAIYDIRGALVKTLLDENRNVGEHALPWDGTDSKRERVVSGVYFMQVQAPEARVVRRVTVLK